MSKPTRWRLLVVLSFMLVSLGFTVVHNRAVDQRQPSPVISPILSLMAWVRQGLGVIGNPLVTLIGGVRHLHRLSEEVRQLRSQVQSLEGLKTRLKELEEENRRLAALLGLKTSYPKGLPSRIIGRNLSPWSQVVVVDRGVLDGVQPRWVAITEGGLVGQVSNVIGPHSSVVLTLTDPNSGVAVVDRRSGVAGIVEGLGEGRVWLTHLPPNPDVRPEDVLVTSGMGGVFPKGLPVGTVKNIERTASGTEPLVWVEPFVKLSLIEEVLLLPSHLSIEGNYRP